MTFISSTHNVNEVKSNFNEVCDFLQELLDKIGKKTSVKSTKLYQYKNQLNNITNENIENYTKTLHIIQRYNYIILTIKNNKNYFDFKEATLIKIIEGTSEIDDLKDKSNHLLFELEMAVRFFQLSKNNGKPAKINLSDNECDIIFDDFFAVECKYIESKKICQIILKKQYHKQ